MKWTTENLTAILRDRHAGQHEAIVCEVPNATGLEKSRSADAMAMGLWPSRGLDLHGYEIKASRSDWLKEIQDHSKADTFARYCDFWWIVAAPKIVKPEEMPGSWGLLEPAKTGSKLMVRKGADRTEAQPIDREFLAALFRVVSQQSPSVKLLESFWNRGYDTHRRTSRREDDKLREAYRESDKRRFEELKKAVDDFEAASGIRIEAYRGKRLGEAVAHLNSNGLERCFVRAKEEVDKLTAALEKATSLRDALKPLAEVES